MSFNQNNKNPSNHPPWQRSSQLVQNTGQQGINLQQLGQLGFQNQPNYQNLPLLQQMGQNMNQLFTQTVSYPTPRSLNPMAFQQNSQQQQQQQQQGQNNQIQSKFNPQQRSFSGTGMVTKLSGDLGFIDDEVFFHKNVCVKGSSPKIGDKVLVEAAYNQNIMKWNATRVQVLSGAGMNMNNRSQNNSSTNMSLSSSGYNSVAPPALHDNSDNYRSQSRRNYSPAAPTRQRTPEYHGGRSHEVRQREADLDELDRKRRREERDKDREKNREARHKETVERKERSPIRRSSPKRRRTRVAPRYMVQIPKVSLTLKSADILEIRRRYGNLYIPSDFYGTNIKWVDAFPPNAPFSIQKPCTFHVMHKEVVTVEENYAVLEPSDADYLYSAKVMLLSTPPMQEFYKRCFATADADQETSDERDFIHPTRLINFLVGVRGKNETMAIGGAWSKSLDGPNPDTDPTVLIRTAIRNCKALTGIDLSNCTQWFRFAEFNYRRADQTYKGRAIGARVEKVVIYLPDVRSCLPTRLEYEELRESFKATVHRLINLPAVEEVSIQNGDHKSATAAPEEPIISISDDDKNININSNNSDYAEPLAAADVPADNAAVTENDEVPTGTAETDKDESAEGDGMDVDMPNQLSFDLKTMKVNELRAELEARNLNTKGLKSQLTARLLKALKAEADPASEVVDGDCDEIALEPEVETVSEDVAIVANNKEIEEPEQIAEESIDAELDMNDVTIIDEYDSTKPEKVEEPPKKESVIVKKMDEKERQQLEKRYTLPESPNIIVHPSKLAKSGKFDCTVMSLSLLLDYRPEDTKEHSFEVSLFAELFNEMLMRDFGFNIYKNLYLLPIIKPKEEKKTEETKPVVEKSESKEKNKDETIKIEDNKSEPITIDDDDVKEVPVDEVEKGSEIVEKPIQKDDQTAEKPEKNEVKDIKEKEKEKKSVVLSREKEREREKPKRSSEAPKRRREDDSDDSFSTKSGTDSNRKSKDKKEKDKERMKMVTVLPELLLSFVYFDQTHCGFIYEKDIENLFFTLGLNLSRSQTRKVVEKFITRESLYYRKLTDKSRDETFVNPMENITEKMIQELIQGNLSAIKPIEDDVVMVDDEPQATSSNGTTVESENGLVLFNGGLFDLKNLLEQVKRSEYARESIETLLVDLRKQNNDLTVSNTRANTKIKDLSSDLKSYGRKLTDAEQSLSSSTRKCNEYFSLLANFYEKVTPIVQKNEKSSRRESSRSEKDKDKKDVEPKKEIIDSATVVEIIGDESSVKKEK